MAKIDAPSWTFGLNPETPGILVPGPGTYDVAGRLVAEGVGTRFGGSRDRTNIARLVFDAEDQARQKPGPGAYNLGENRPLRRKLKTPARLPPEWNDHSPRFSVPSLATDAGPGAYIRSQFTGKGPAYSLAARPPIALDVPESPGPGQYVEVKLSVGQQEKESEEGFGKRSSPRFATEIAEGPGPGSYKYLRFGHWQAKGITVGQRFRPAGWSAKIKGIAPFLWEPDCERNSANYSRGSRFRSTLQRHDTFTALQAKGLLRRRPSSAPPSTRLQRACARGRRLTERDDHDGQQGANKRSIADKVKEAGRRRKAQAVEARGNWRKGTARSNTPRIFGTAPQRPPGAPPAPGPSSYRPLTLDEAARNGKVFGIGSKSGRELFPPSPDTPGPVQYAPEVIQGPVVQDIRRAGRDALVRSALRFASPANAVVAESSTVPLPTAGTFGSSERFPRDSELRPGVGEYDLRAAEKARGAGSTAVAISLGRRPGGAPYEPSLDRYISTDGRSTPSPQAYRPESAAGGGGECGVGGHAPAPPAWSFTGKFPAPRPPDGPGPGRFRPPYTTTAPSIRFAAGRGAVPGCISGVPWVEIAERAARGEGGGGEAKLYLPGRLRMGAKAFLSSRSLPRPVKRVGAARE